MDVDRVLEVTQITADYDMSDYLVEWSYPEFPRR